MIINRPAIMVYVNEPDKSVLREVCAGIEEEGVPYQVQPWSAGLCELAFQAAGDSMLGTGIGIAGRSLALQMQRLPKEKPVFELELPRPWQSRNMGMNAARAVKKMPFKPIDI